MFQAIKIWDEDGPQVVLILSSPRPWPVLVPKVLNLSRPRPIQFCERARTKTVPGRLVPSYGPPIIRYN